MRRREFIAFVGGAVAWPRQTRAQQAAKRPTIGFLGPLSQSVMNPWIASFEQRLSELGWIAGSLAIEYRWADGSDKRASEIAAEFVRMKVDIIVTSGTSNVIAAKQATTVIPIVFAAAGNPVENKLVATLARPGGNVTGQSNQSTDLAGKQVELLREVVPGLARLAILANVANPVVLLDMREVKAAASTLGLKVITLEIRNPDDIASVFGGLKARADALFVAPNPLVNTHRAQINTLALTEGLPTMHGLREHVEAGGLMSYGPSFTELYRRSAEYVDKILKGAKPADLPIQQPTTFELVINLKTAKQLGLKIPPSLLARADEVIE